jgi:hypothetical protein
LWPTPDPDRLTPDQPPSTIRRPATGTSMSRLPILWGSPTRRVHQPRRPSPPAGPRGARPPQRRPHQRKARGGAQAHQVRRHLRGNRVGLVTFRAQTTGGHGFLHRVCKVDDEPAVADQVCHKRASAKEWHASILILFGWCWCMVSRPPRLSIDATRHSSARFRAAALLHHVGKHSPHWHDGNVHYNGKFATDDAAQRMLGRRRSCVMLRATICSMAGGKACTAACV